MSHIKRFVGVVLLVFGMSGFATLPASAATFHGSVEPNDILKILKENGYGDARVADTDYEGLPIINFTLADAKAVVYFYGCGKTGKVCELLQLYVGWSKDQPPSTKAISDFNAAERFSQAYIDDEDDPVIEQWVALEGGISDVNFIYTVISFEEVVEKFKKLVNSQES